MSAEIIHLHTAIHIPAHRTCWPCVVIWVGMPMFWVGVFALVLWRTTRG